MNDALSGGGEEPESLPAAHEYFMEQALAQARRALDMGETPVGAVVALDGAIIGRGCNAVIHHCDPTAHAEINALRDAAQKTGNYRLTGADLYVSLEPCWMCYGAMVHARIRNLYYAAPDPKGGVLSTSGFMQIRNNFNHHITIQSGFNAAQSALAAQILKDFFRLRRRSPIPEPPNPENL